MLGEDTHAQPMGKLSRAKLPRLGPLIRSPDGAAEGQVFGEAKALQAAFLVGACTLQLESGAAVKAVLLGCESTGAASIRVAAAV